MIIISCRPVFVNMKMDVQRNPSESVSVHIRRIIYTFPVDFIAEKHIIESSPDFIGAYAAGTMPLEKGWCQNDEGRKKTHTGCAGPHQKLCMLVADAGRTLACQARRLRLAARLSQEKLCAELQRRGCDIGRTTSAKYEAGELNIRASVLIELKALYACPYDEFFADLPGGKTE